MLNQHKLSENLPPTREIASCERVLLLASIALAVLAKLWLSLNTYGTNDITSWKVFADHIYPDGLLTIYSSDDQFNHPPAIAMGLWLLNKSVENAPDWFPFVFRLPAILADIGSTYLVWIFASNYIPSRRRLLLVIIFALNPVSIMISGFHGNTDPIFIFLILASSFTLVFKSAPTLAGCLFGMALNVKIVPLIVLPAFFFWLEDRKRRGFFCASAAIVFLAGFAYHLTLVPGDVLRNVFGYDSFGGTWGISRFAGSPEWYFTFAKLLIVTLVIGYSYVATLSNKTSQHLNTIKNRNGEGLIRTIGGIFIIFLVFTPGFGVQYLVWFLPFSVFWGLFHLAYTTLSSCFIFFCYTYWSGGLPWDYANSWEPGGSLVFYNISVLFGLFTWFSLFLLFVKETRYILFSPSYHDNRL